MPDDNRSGQPATETLEAGDNAPVPVDSTIRASEAEDTLRAIGAGEVDAFVLSDGFGGRRVFTLETADRPYRIFVENMREGAATVSSAGIVLFANRRLAELLSCSRDSVVGAPLSQFMAGDVHLTLADIRGPGGDGATIEFDLLDADGHPVAVMVGSSPLEIDGDQLTCLTFTDLRAQHEQDREIARLAQEQSDRVQELVDAQLEQGIIRIELARSEQRLQAILDNSPAAVHVKDLDGRYVFVNRQCEIAYALHGADVIGRSDLELWPHDLDMALADRAEELAVIHTGEAQQSERTTDDAAGTHTRLSVTFPLFDSGGVVYSTACMSTDITERKRAESDRVALVAQLNQSQRLEGLGQLAAGVAHDFNNLLAVIFGYTELVAEATTGAVREDVEQIQEAAERAARLTRQLLIFGRRDLAEARWHDLDVIVAEIRELLARTIGEHVELVVRSEDSLAAIHADRGQIDQVLLNLAVNARHAMPEGGTLTVATSCIEARDDGTHPDLPPGRYVQLSVTDTGTGMNADVAARAFEPFFTTKPQGEGSGLGLATVYGIVADAGGDITIDSEEGVGTTIRISLPQTTAAPTLEVADTVKLRGAGQTILVVEDGLALLTVTARLLEANGYVVLQANSGDEALAIARENEFHLLLTDLAMPKLSGSLLTVKLRAVHPNLPVVFMSGYSRDVLGSSQPTHQDIALLQKPFTEHDLLIKVQEAFDDDDTNGVQPTAPDVLDPHTPASEPESTTDRPASDP